LLKAGKKVEVVSDAIQHLDAAAGSAMLREFAEMGGTVTTTRQICG
jgi:hypothetical protein